MSLNPCLSRYHRQVGRSSCLSRYHCLAGRSSCESCLSSRSIRASRPHLTPRPARRHHVAHRMLSRTGTRPRLHSRYIAQSRGQQACHVSRGLGPARALLRWAARPTAARCGGVCRPWGRPRQAGRPSRPADVKPQLSPRRSVAVWPARPDRDGTRRGTAPQWAQTA
jgi:hypothetical protein